MDHVDSEPSGEILIVDDEPGIRLLLSECIKKEGFRPIVAGNGRQALEVVRKQYPDLVLLDMNIPGINGADALREIKRINSDIKVMIMTAYTDKKMISQLIGEGAITCFTKPFDLAELMAAIRHEVTLV
jgi:two-component system response regulator (stage 0 sporulation protein F)